jgi:hypothetical protein
MAREVHKFAVTVPAGTPIAAPSLTQLAMPPREVTAVHIVVPPGPRGLVGFSLGSSGNPIIPYEPGAFVVADDEVIDWPLEEQITSGAWELRAYNLGRYAHTLEIRFLCDLLVQVAGDPAPVALGAGPPPLPDQPAVLTGAGTPLAFLGFGG